MEDQFKPWLAHYDQGVPKSLTYPNISLVDLFRMQVDARGREPLILWESQQYSYRQVEMLTNKLRDGLLAVGCRAGDRIGLILPNIPAFVIGFLAIIKLGGVVVALNPSYQEREFEFHLQDSGVTTVIAIDAVLPKLEIIKDVVPLEKIVLVYPQQKFSTIDQPTRAVKYENRTSEGIMDLKDLLALSGNIVREEKINPDTPAIIQYSGGTTGIPKGAIGTHRNILANVIQFSTWLLLDQSPMKILTAIPLFHVYGMVLSFWLAIKLGTAMVMVHQPGDIESLFKAVRKHKPGIFPCVPSLYNAILRSPDLDNFATDLKALKVCISGSAPLSAETKQKFEEHIDGRLVEGYGLSEAPTATHCNPVVGKNISGSIGMPLPDVDCKLVDIDNPDVEIFAGEIGELLLRGPQVMAGYHQRKDDNHEIFFNGWLRTGDIVRMDEDGYFYIVGRKKDLIKVGGLQVWPAEIEGVISSMQGITEVVVAGVEDDLMGEIPIAWVVTDGKVQLDEEAILAFCSRNLARYKLPREVIMIEKIPRSTVGKVLRRVLVEEYQKKKLS